MAVSVSDNAATIGNSVVRVRINSSGEAVELFYRAIPDRRKNRFPVQEVLDGVRSLFGGDENFISTNSDYVMGFAPSDFSVLEIEMPVGTFHETLTNPENARIHNSLFNGVVGRYTDYPVTDYKPFVSGNGDKYLQLKLENDAFNIGFMQVKDVQEWFMQNIVNIRTLPKPK